VTAGLAERMAAYRRGMTQKVTCGLMASTPESSLGPALGNESGRTLYIFIVFKLLALYKNDVSGN